jgi:hypothetical protein
MLTEEQIRKMLANPMQADWSKLQASDIGFSMGRALTEEEMKAYCAQNGIAPTVIKGPAPKPSGGSGPSDVPLRGAKQKKQLPKKK